MRSGTLAPGGHSRNADGGTGDSVVAASRSSGKSCCDTMRVDMKAGRTERARANRASYGMEARVGIEPTNKGFADLCLTTWLPRRGFRPSLVPTGSWSGRRDSNPRHRPWQGRTLPAELLPLENLSIAHAPALASRHQPRNAACRTRECLPSDRAGRGFATPRPMDRRSSASSAAAGQRGIASLRIASGARAAGRLCGGGGILGVSDDRTPRGWMRLGSLPLRRSTWQAHHWALGCDANC